jgi:NAD(P)-dependent dehydrogenase (short-subunit alcohol dehydrogenase family)
MTQQVYLVVGASTGLGRATAVALAAAGHRVVVAGRGEGSDVRVDLRDLGDVARAAGELAAMGVPFDGVVCNAGVQFVGDGERTRDGFEPTFAVNHLAHFALVSALALAPGTRVAMIGSGTIDPGERFARMFGFHGSKYTSARALAKGESAEANEAQRAKDRYATSKMCNVMTAMALARRDGLAAFAFDPGLMPGTALVRDHNALARFAWSTVLHLMPGTSTATRSGRALAALVQDAGVEPGTYFDFRKQRMPLPDGAPGAAQADELYDISRLLIAEAATARASATATAATSAKRS